MTDFACLVWGQLLDLVSSKSAWPTVRPYLKTKQCWRGGSAGKNVCLAPPQNPYKKPRTVAVTTASAFRP